MSHLRMCVIALAVACACRAPAQVVWERIPLFPNTPGSPWAGNDPGDHRMVWDSARQHVMLVNGYGDVWEWDGSWTRVHASPFPPSPISLAYDAHRQRAVLYSEGLTWEWDGTRWTQRFPATTPPFRTYEHLVYDAARRRVLLFGGRNAAGSPLDDTWEWDGRDWTRRFPPTAPAARYAHAMVYDAARSRVLLFGGSTRSPFLGDFDDTWEWDGTSWSRLSSALSPGRRAGHDMAYDAARQRIVLWGGTQAGSPLLWEWDGATWTSITPPIRPRFASAPAMAYDHARQRTVLWYGYGDTWEWDGDNWTVTAESPRAANPALAYDAGAARSVFLAIGRSAPAAMEHWEWDGARWTQRPAAPLPPVRSEHAMAYDAARARVVLFAGYGAPADTWEWDGTDWTQRLVAAPQSRYGHAMVYDASRRQTVMFGGFVLPRGRSPSDETWEWDGTSWRQRAPATVPSARGQTAIAYDAGRQRTVLFGGAATSSSSAVGLGDTWEWDGTTWIRRTPALSPPPRSQHTLVYDSFRQRVVLFGGQHEGKELSDTWEWDGSTWLRRSPSMQTAWPSGATREPAATYDAARRRIVMFDDVSTWEYDTASPAAYAPFGAGCAGPAGVPLLGAAPGSLPWAESSFTVQLAPIVPGQPAVLFFGASSTSWSGIPLPLALGVLGRPDCTVLASLDVAVPLVSAGGSATLTIPLGPTLVGGVFYNQGASLDLTSGTAGLAFSNGARAQIGAR